MNILAIETATAFCSVALETENNVISCFEATARQHASQILPMIDSVLKEAGLAISQVSAIAISIGPGSFTGLRIGVGVAQGLAFPFGIPIIPISTLAIIAQGLICQQDVQNKKIAVLLDAHMKEVFFGAYQVHNGLVQVLEQDQLISIDKILPNPPLRKEGTKQILPNLSLEKEGKIIAPRCTGEKIKVSPLCKGGQGGFFDFVLTDLNINSLPYTETVLQLNTLQLPSAMDVLTLAKHTTNRIEATHLQPVYLRTENAWKKQS